jgi:acetolactate synthase small subunit
MKNKEKIPDNFENAVENKDSSFSVEREIKKEVIDERDPEEILEKIIEKSVDKTKVEDNIKKSFPEDEKVLFYIKKSIGVSTGAVIKVINKVKKKLSPYGVDKYHDELTKKKDDQ